MPKVAETVIVVEFAEHIPIDRISSMVTGMAACGNVDAASNGRTYTVRIFRASNLPYLKKKLTSWERYGFIQWKQDG